MSWVRKQMVWIMLALVVVAFAPIALWAYDYHIAPSAENDEIRQESTQEYEEYSGSITVPAGAEIDFALDEVEAALPPAVEGDQIAWLTLRLEDGALSAKVLEGIGNKVLDQGVIGHYPVTDSPCGEGNFAVSAHRTTKGAWFRNIDTWPAGTRIDVEDVRTGESCTYILQSVTHVIDVGSPEDHQALLTNPPMAGVAAGMPIMTLVSCGVNDTDIRVVRYAEREE